jgi:ABC-type phosphate transport system, periplasmic component
MKKLSIVLAVLMITTLSVFAQGSKESASNPISVISREEGSGTRGAFVELIGVIDSNKNDITTLDAAITNSTSVMMLSVAENKSAIGYISLGSLNDTVKAVKVDGVVASAENIKNGSYKIARPFNIVTKGEVSPLAADFISFILSADGQNVVGKSYIKVNESAPRYEGKKMSGKITVAGSSSVTPVMEKLKEAYQAIQSDVNIEIQLSDSSTGVKSAVSGIADIGMASRDLKDSEKSQGAVATAIAMDGIAVIVNKSNAVDGMTSSEIKEIYLGNLKDWNGIAK